MSLELMKQRLNIVGGQSQQTRMLEGKLWTMRHAIKHSYQGARFTKWPEEKEEVRGLFNPVTHNQNYDTKMISSEWKNKFKPGDIFKWCNTGSYWICFDQDKTELAYFRGECRRCDWKTNWIDKDHVPHTMLLSIIGPSASQLRTSASMQAGLAEEFPNANLVILVPDNPVNAEYFNRYGHFIIRGLRFDVQNIDNLSMPGVIRIKAFENYTNMIDDNVERDTTNYWNVQPVIKEKDVHLSAYGIDGPEFIKPKYEYTYTGIVPGGYWVILENDLQQAKRWPVDFTTENRHQQEITLVWNHRKQGSFTLEYRTPSQTYTKFITVESLL